MLKHELTRRIKDLDLPFDLEFTSYQIEELQAVFTDKFILKLPIQVVAAMAATIHRGHDFREVIYRLLVHDTVHEVILDLSNVLPDIGENKLH